jgi:26S proteasome regulatory subunit T4
LNPELFVRVGIKPPKGVLLYGPPGTGKTLLARAVAATLQTNFLKVVSSAIVDKYIGESARVVREMFGYARDHEPCVIFMDEIDAIGGRRFSEGTSADREIQRTLMEVSLSTYFPHIMLTNIRFFSLAFESNGWI